MAQIFVSFYPQKSGNGTDDGAYVINTGTDNVDNVNEIDTWRGKPYVS